MGALHVGYTEINSKGKCIHSYLILCSLRSCRSHLKEDTVIVLVLCWMSVTAKPAVNKLFTDSLFYMYRWVDTALSQSVFKRCYHLHPLRVIQCWSLIMGSLGSWQRKMFYQSIRGGQNAVFVTKVCGENGENQHMESRQLQSQLGFSNTHQGLGGISWKFWEIHSQGAGTWNSFL